MSTPHGTATFEQLEAVLSTTAIKHFSPGHQYPILRMDARELLNPRRFDLGVKLRFHKSIVDRRNTHFEQDLYIAHLAVWNGFFETAPAKFGPEDYVESYRKLIEGFDRLNFNKLLLPVDNKFTLIDGAHRASIAALYHQDVLVVQTPNQGNSYDSKYFQSRCEGLSPELSNLLLDQMAFSYCLFKESTRVICVMPSTKGQFREKIEERIQKDCEIVYQKRFKLSRELFDQFILHLYLEDAGWIGTMADDFFGARDKAGRCYQADEELSIYFVDNLSPEAAVALKAEIRSHFSLDKDACHINDNYRETMTLAELMLNPAWEVLSKIRLGDKCPNFASCMGALKKFANENDIDRNELCIGGSAIFALLGHRDCSDLDLLLGGSLKDRELPPGVSSHANQANYYPAPIENIIHDPSLHFSFLGFKFARPEVILKFKRTRNEVPKDLRDIISLLKDFPDLDKQSTFSLSKEKILESAQVALDKTIRDNERTIDKYQDTIHNWYIPELERLQGLISVSQQSDEVHTKQIESLREQVSFLEKLIQGQARGHIE